MISNLLLRPVLPAPRTTNDPALLNQTTNSGKSFLAYYNQGNAYYKLGDYEETIDNFKRCVLIPRMPKHVNEAMPLRDCTHSGDPDKQYREQLRTLTTHCASVLMQQKLMLAEVGYATSLHNIAKT